jgi:hypothetical protein
MEQGALLQFERRASLGPGTGKNVPVEVVVMAMRRVSFAALRVTRRALVFGRASSQDQKGSTHFHRAPALRKVIDLKPL